MASQNVIPAPKVVHAFVVGERVRYDFAFCGRIMATDEICNRRGTVEAVKGKIISVKWDDGDVSKALDVNLDLAR